MPTRSALSIALAVIASGVGLAATVDSATAAHRLDTATTPVASTPSPAADDSASDSSDDAVDDCSTRNTEGTACQAGNGRKVAGGGDKVSHAGWPAVTGILWIVHTKKNGTYNGTALNDELLGHGASDTINGLGGDDIIWGDFDPNGNGANQNDKLNGGDGDDFIYSSHGKNTLTGGAGNDFIYAYYGHGTIDCGPGKQDTAKIHLDGNPYKVKNCERILNFCAFGSIDNKRCAKPGEKKSTRAQR